MARILCIDDDAAVLGALVKALRRFGHDPVAADSAETGLELLGALHTDLIILDLGLPGVSGMDVLNTLKQLGSQVPVIVMTGHDSARVAVKAMHLGAVDYLTKPVTFGDLEQAVARALGPGAAPGAFAP
jgi:two-component system response regulator AtoC